MPSTTAPPLPPGPATPPPDDSAGSRVSASISPVFPALSGAGIAVALVILMATARRRP